MVGSRLMGKLRAVIDEAGGLHTRAGLARRWGVSKTYVSDVVTRDDFPEPATYIDADPRHPAWAGKDADAWRAEPRRPGPKSS